MDEDTGPITVDQAVGLLEAIRPPDEVEAPVAAAETEVIPEGEPTPEDAEEPVEAIPEGEEVEQPVEAIARPQSWAADDQAAWEAVPDDVKPVILARETERDRATQKAVQSANDATRRYEAQIQDITQVKAVLDQTLPQVVAMNQNKWSSWTPQTQAEMARTDPAQFIALKAEFDRDQAVLAQAHAANQHVQSAAFSEFVREQEARLPELVPDLADAKEGPTRRKALAAFLATQGIPDDQISKLDAVAISIAYDAMRYRQSRGHLAQPKPPAPVRPALKPAAASTVRTPQREAEAAKNRFSQTRSVEDAVAFLNKRSG